MIYDNGHAEEWMKKHPHGWYHNEGDYGIDWEDPDQWFRGPGNPKWRDLNELRDSYEEMIEELSDKVPEGVVLMNPYDSSSHIRVMYTMSESCNNFIMKLLRKDGGELVIANTDDEELVDCIGNTMYDENMCSYEGGALYCYILTNKPCYYDRGSGKIKEVEFNPMI